jgi:twitching motility two-component system response regulator PilG
MNSFILIIDDSPTIRKLAEMTLQKADYNGVSFADGESALQWLDEHLDVRPTLVLLDVHLPGIDGYTWAMHIKSKLRFQSTSIVLMSGEPVSREKIRVAGITASIEKPFTIQKLLTMVQAQMQAQTLLET